MFPKRWPWTPSRWNFPPSLLLFLLLIATPFPLPTPESSVEITRVREGDYALLPACTPPSVRDYKSRGWNWTHNNMQILSRSEFIIPNPLNGSLTVQVQLADVNSKYQCEAYVVLANQTIIKGEIKTHFIIPIVPAFLTNPPTNRSIRWAAYYTFLCDAGGTDATLERRLNGQIVRRRRVRIFNDSLVECRAYNSVSDRVEKAYLTIIPESRQDDLTDLLSGPAQSAMASAVPSAASTPNDSALVATDNRDCYVDRGQDYRGPAVALANCLSWEEVAQFSPLEDDSVTREDEGNGMSTDLPSGQPSMSQIGWPGLFTLTPTLFPDTLGSSSSPSSLLSVPSEAPATCRNPLGLAPQPFCLVAHAVDPDSSTPQLVPIPCFQLPSCAQLRAAALITEAPSPSTDIGAVSFLFGIVGVTLFIFLLAYVVQVRLDKRDPPGKQVLAISQVTGPQAHRLAQLQRRRLVRRTPRPLRCLLLRLLRSGRHLPSKPSEATLKGCPSSDDHVSCFTCGSKTAKGLPTPASTKIFDSVDEEDEEFEQLAASMRVPVRQSVGAPPALPACFPAAFNGSGDTVDGLSPDESSILARTQLSDQPTYFEKGPRADQAAFEVDTYYSVEAVGNVLHPKLKSLAYPRKLLTELRPIAQRAFGTVILARAPNLPVSVSHSPSDAVQSTTGPSVSPTTSPLVVIKTLHFNADSVAQFSFLREAELLVEFNHPNILKVLGLCVPLQPLTLVCEYMPRGDLNSCLRRLQAAGDSGEESALSVDRLLGIAADICEAMIYLGYKSYVHRDLATRSCLLATDWTAKLSDFSMCRLVNRGADLVDRGVSALPVRWLPVESLLDGIFNFDTDVWSFGVFLWELFTFGAVPFEDASVSEIIKGLLTGKRLSCPDGCCPAVYELMLQCWSDDRSQRPTFLHIKKTLSSLAAR
nr:unnamed protein product [Spirometra erinaceieuropaei]